LNRFSTVVFDVDSTLSGIEGIDWLAERRGAEVAATVAALTARAMEGEAELQSVYGKRLELVRPSREDVSALGEAYVSAITPQAKAVISELQSKHVGVHLVSGGIAQAVNRLAGELSVPLANVHAVGAYFDDSGQYAGYDRESPLTQHSGKRALLATLHLEKPVLMLGDGVTDLEAAPAVDSFVAFTGYASRPAVIAGADHAISELGQLLELIFG
jgi:phosphoserine phosphatase